MTFDALNVAVPIDTPAQDIDLSSVTLEHDSIYLAIGSADIMSYAFYSMI